jgi:hypothetical protein
MKRKAVLGYNYGLPYAFSIVTMGSALTQAYQLLMVETKIKFQGSDCDIFS